MTCTVKKGGTQGGGGGSGGISRTKEMGHSRKLNCRREYMKMCCLVGSIFGLAMVCAQN